MHPTLFIVYISRIYTIDRGFRCITKNISASLLSESRFPSTSGKSKTEDRRQSGKIDYSLHDCLLSGFTMMFFQDPSILTFQQRLQDKIQKNNLIGASCRNT